ncbi:MAG: alpha-galactosidase, partial [Clostridiales bacterium]|nr:alpha-galactosidase [Clostridiales bacterium]
MKKSVSGLLKFSALSAGAAALVMAMKRKKIEPVSLTKKAVRSMKLTIPENEKFENGAALTPPMGWSSWNAFRNTIDEDLLLDVAHAMKESGLVDAGYTYLNIDDCWQSSIRDENKKLQGDYEHFSKGIKSLVERVNPLGIKLGIYSSNGTLTCEDLPASLGYESIDAQTFAEWGVEYFKYDFCHNVPIPMRAPYLESISVSKAGSKEEIVYNAAEAVLIGEARIVEDDKLETGTYIAGLTAGGGAVEFDNVEVDSEGEYILTLTLRKKSNSYKYFELLINGEEIYSSLVPPTRAWSAQGRHQMKISLSKGKNTIKIYNPVASKQDSAAIQYIKMGEELVKATKAFAEKTGQPEKPIVYSICEWGLNFPWNWGKQAGNLWRTTPDIKPYWASILGIYEINILLHKHSAIGAWNDPDMLEVGNGNLTYDENLSHFTLWC